jgi:uncharacterized membrane protein
MRLSSKIRLFGTTAIALILVNHLGVELQPPAQSWQFTGDRAEARSSGGRSRGGSFSRPSRGGNAPSRSAPTYRNPDYYPQRPVPIPIPGGYGYGGYSFGGFGFLLLLLLLGGGAILPIMWMYFMRGGRGNSGSTYAGNGYVDSSYVNSNYVGNGYAGNGYGGNREVENDVVTVTRLQIALLAQARYIQESLTELTLQADTESQQGLSEMLQESVLALLRAPENWTHVRVNSQTVKSREEASQLFEQISIEERSKFSAETLANVGGKVRRQAMPTSDDDAPASYIVVTLILGTADDRPLLKDKIHSSQELQAFLQRIGSVTPDYLMVFELLWSPQEASDSLTYDELLTEYPGLVQI